MQQQFKYNPSHFPPLQVPRFQGGENRFAREKSYVAGNGFSVGNAFAVENDFNKSSNEAGAIVGDPLSNLFNAIKDLQNQNISIKEELSQIRLKYVSQDQSSKNFIGLNERLTN